MYICICNAVTERQIRACVDRGARSLSDLQLELGVATGCGCCAQTACEYLSGKSDSGVCNVRTLAAPGDQPSVQELSQTLPQAA